MDKITKIPVEDMTIIMNAKNRAIMAAMQAEKVVAEAKVAELEHRSTIQQIYLKHGLTLSCKINETTGVVEWPEEKPEEKPEE